MSNENNTKPTKDAGAQDEPQAKPTVAHMLGEVTWLFSQSTTHKHFAIADLEWMVMPALFLEQYRIFRGPNPNAPEGVEAAEQPMGVAFWALLSEAAEQKLEAGGTRLRPDEWKSGDRLWLVDLVAPFATTENKLREAMLGDLAQNVFPGRKIKMHSTDVKTGERTVIEIGAEE